MCCQIYKDHSYEFSRHFHSLIEKCLRKDPTRRPSVKKLLEHKFFKAAKDKNYVVEKIVKRMTLTTAPPPNTRLLNLCELRHPTIHHGANGAGDADDGEDKDRPISVGSWVFDKKEFDEMKLRAAEEKVSGMRMIEPDARYHCDLGAVLTRLLFSRVGAGESWRRGPSQPRAAVQLRG